LRTVTYGGLRTGKMGLEAAASSLKSPEETSLKETEFPVFKDRESRSLGRNPYNLS
jgi:hypothetical protein